MVSKTNVVITMESCRRVGVVAEINGVITWRTGEKLCFILEE